jgi:hypothetical protein
LGRTSQWIIQEYPYLTHSRKDAILSMLHHGLAKCLNVFCWL